MSLPKDEAKMLAEVCETYKLEYRLMLSIIQVESSYNRYALRYEPDYKWLYKTAKFAKSMGCTEATETVMQKTSWGFFQIMAAVAREGGHILPIPLLLNPLYNFNAGCAHFAKGVARYDGDQWKAVSAYNAGSYVADSPYELKVRAAYAGLSGV